MNKIDRIKSINDHYERELQDSANKHPDIKDLLSEYNAISKQKWSEDFLKGYMACISDLMIIKKKLR